MSLENFIHGHLHVKKMSFHLAICIFWEVEMICVFTGDFEKVSEKQKGNKNFFKNKLQKMKHKSVTLS